MPTRNDAVEVVGGSAEACVVLSCEHASARLPAPYVWHADDAWLATTHWAYDLGARELTLELAAALEAPAVLSTVSRLLVDPNRAPAQADLFRAMAEGRPVRLNQGLEDAERAARMARYYEPFHAALDGVLGASPAPLLLSIHSFTPRYEGVVRSVELGVLFNREEVHGRALAEHLGRSFAGVRENEPWSGRAGLIYSAEFHAERFGKVALELEVRQDLACDPAYRARLVPALASFVHARFSAPEAD